MLIVNDVEKLEEYGFIKEDNEYVLNGEEYEDEYGDMQYRWHMSVGFNTKYQCNSLYIDIMNNDCTYHNDNFDIGEVYEVFFRLVKDGIVDMKVVKDDD